MSRLKGQNGKFIQRSDEPRQVRSLRLTDSTWQALGNFADEKNITRADLIEDFAINNNDVLHGQSCTNNNDVLHGVISIEAVKVLAKKLLRARTSKLETITKIISAIYNVEIDKVDLE